MANWDPFVRAARRAASTAAALGVALACSGGEKSDGDENAQGDAEASSGGGGSGGGMSMGVSGGGAASGGSGGTARDGGPAGAPGTGGSTTMLDGGGGVAVDGGPAPSGCGPVAPRTAPPLPAPSGSVVEVSTVAALMSAVSSLSNGTTILLEDGTYYLPGLLRFRNYVENITLRSKSGNRDAVIIDGSQSSSSEMIWFEEVRNVTVADVTVQNALVHCFTVKGEADADGVRIYNAKIKHCWERYVKGTAPSPIETADPARRPRNGRIEYCSFEQDYPKQQDDAFNGDYIGGIDMMWLDNWVISDNTFVGIQGRNNQGRGAIFIWNNSEDVTVERNRVVGCDTGIAFGNPSGSVVHMTRGILRNNMITRGNYKAIELARTHDSEIYNNSVYSELATFDRMFHVFDTSAGNTVWNNLVHGYGIRVDDGGAMLGENLTGMLDGYFVDPPGGDLHLTATGAAAAVGQGEPVPAGLDDFDGQARPTPAAFGADECTP